MHTKQMHIRSHEPTVLTSSFPQSMTARLLLNLLKSRYTIAMLQWSTAYGAFPLAITNNFECMKTARV